jgi:hypothetical protein
LIEPGGTTRRQTEHNETGGGDGERINDDQTKQKKRRNEGEDESVDSLARLDGVSVDEEKRKMGEE